MSQQMGVNLKAHRSAIVTGEDLAWADVIVVMDRHNWQASRRAGADPGKLVWLGAMHGHPEIEDPYGMPGAVAWSVMQRLDHCTRELGAIITMADPQC